jgi:NADPH:quinone reductase-like Zn-dependent oxidoreductase
MSGRDNLCRNYAILGENTRGGYAEFIVVPASSILPFPEGMDFEHAACLPLTFQTAWQLAVRRARVKAGQSVLIHGAGSGVTVAAVQICKVLGAVVIVTSTKADKLHKIAALGADHTILSTEQDVAREVKKLTGGRGVDVILDHVGAPMFEQNLRSVAWGGTIATCGATGGFDAMLDLRQIFFKQIGIVGSTMGSKADLWEVLRLVQRGEIVPVLDRVFPLAEAASAHEYLEQGAQFGKVVLRID